MQRRKPKSARHQRAAQARWRAAEARADQERADGIPDRAPDVDMRRSVLLDLTSHGGPCVRLEPRLGYISVRVIDEATGKVLECAALKTALHRLADRLPRTLGARNRT